MAEHELNKIVDDDGEVFNLRDSTKQPTADRVTSWGSTPSDTKYPSEKLVKTSLNSSVLYANQKWGGAFRASLSPLDTYFILNKNYFLGVAANCVSVEYSTDGGSTWLDYGLTDLQKRNLFNQFATVDVYCGKNTHIQPGYTGSITGTKDLTDDIIANQRLRITISSRPFGNAGTTSRTGEWMICSQMRRFAIYMSTQSASSKTHCKVQSRTIANFCSGTNTWVDHGDYPIVGDSGWNSIPIGNDSAEGGFGFGSYDSVSTTNRSEFRFEIWSEKLNTNPASSQTGNLCIKTICSIADKLSTTTSKFRSILYNGLCCTSIDMENGWPVFGNGIKFTARKLKTNLARTADSTFDGSADQTNIPVTGTLPVANGGTGKTSVTAGNYLVGNGTSALTEKTPNTAANELINALSTGESTPTGEDYYVAQYAGGGTTTKTYHRRPVKALWEYIKGQISSILGLTATSYGGNAATATAAQSGSALETAINGKAPTSHASSATTYGVGTTSNYGHVKLATGDMNGATHADGVAVSKNHTHSQYLTSHQSIAGKMNTSASNATAPSSSGGDGATATLLNNLTGGNSDISTSNGDNVLFVTTDNGGSITNKWYKRPLSKLWPWIISHTQVKLLKIASESWIGVGTDEDHYIELDYDGTDSSPSMGIWTRWASGSGNAKYMAECDTSGNCRFNGSSESVAGIDADTRNTSTYRLSLGYTTSLKYDGHARAIVTLHSDSDLGGAGSGIGVTILVSIDWKGNSANRHVSARVLNNDSFASNIMPGILVFTDSNEMLHFCVVLLGKTSNSANYELKPFNFTSTRVIKLGGTMNWAWDIQHDSVSTISSSDYVFPAEDCVTHVCQPPSSVIGSGSPAADCKTYWTNFVGKGCVRTVYNNNGQEYTLLFSKSADGKYGTILRWGYRGPSQSNISCIEMLRCQNNTWHTSDWEGLDVKRTTSMTDNSNTSKSIYASWDADEIAKVEPSSATSTKASSKWMFAGYSSGNQVFMLPVNVANVTVGNADTVDNLHLAIGSYAGVANTIYFG